MPVEWILPSSDGFFSGYWCSAASKKRASIQPWCDLVVSVDVDISVAWNSHVAVSGAAKAHVGAVRSVDVVFDFGDGTV